MKKLVLKTALITLGSIVGALCLLYGVFALFFPLNMANFLDSIGMQKGAVSFYELHYERTEDISDLGVLCVKVDELEDSVRAEKYIDLLVSDKGFNDYLISFDEGNVNLISGRDFFYGKLAIAKQKTGGVEKFLSFALDSIEDGYNEYNCFFIALTVEDLFSIEDKAKIKDALLLVAPTLDTEEKVFIERDLEYLK
jgi:hypothetical protein